MLALLQAIYSRFSADANLKSAFPGYVNGFGQTIPVGYYRDEAPEDAPMPYCISTIIPTAPNQVFGGTGPVEVQVQFTAVHRGHDAAMALAETLVSTFDSNSLSLPSFPNLVSVRRLTEIIPVLDEPDAKGNEVWDMTITYSFTINGSLTP